MAYKLISLISCIFALILAFFAYKPALSGDFFWDDYPNLVNNPKVQIQDLSIESLNTAAYSSRAGILKRPISMMSFSLNYYYFGNDSYSFKLTNLLLHLMTAVLFLLLLVKLSQKNKITKDIKYLQVTALLLFAFWALNPYHLSTVAYVVQRMVILSSLFSVTSILFYFYARELLIKNSNYTAIVFLFFSVIFFILSVFSKESGLLTLPIIILLEFIYFKFRVNKFNKTNFIKISFSIIFLIAVGALLYILPWINDYLVAGYSLRDFTLEERIYTQLRLILYYIKWFFLIDINELGFFHDDIIVSKSILSPITTLISLVIIFLLITYAIIYRNKHQLASFGLAWFFIGHALESTILPLEMVYEHRNYFPSMGLILVAYQCLSLLNEKFQKMLPVIGILLSAIVIAAVLQTNRLATVWNNSLDLALHITENHPSSYKANYVLGTTYSNYVEAGNEEYLTDAIDALTAASMNTNSEILPEARMIVLSERLSKDIKLSWINSIVKKLEQSPLSQRDIISLQQLSKCELGKCNLDIQHLKRILDAAFRSPNIGMPSKTRVQLLSIKSNYHLYHDFDIKKAQEYLKEAIFILPNHIPLYLSLLNILIYSEQFSLAQEYLDRAKKFDSSNQYKKELLNFESRLMFHNNKIK